MTKSEMDYSDSSLLGPLLLFLNQYFNILIAEKYVLYFSLVSHHCIDLSYMLYVAKCYQSCELITNILFVIFSRFGPQWICGDTVVKSV
jgi:hypothetical protein